MSVKASTLQVVLDRVAMQAMKIQRRVELGPGTNVVEWTAELNREQLTVNSFLASMCRGPEQTHCHRTVEKIVNHAASLLALAALLEDAAKSLPRE